jgi:hypothetical protein
MERKRKKRYIVICDVQAVDGQSRTITSKPLTVAQASELEEHLRQAGFEPVRYAKLFTDEELERAERLASLGQSADGLGGWE